MSILSSTTGIFTFLDENYEEVTFRDWEDIPEDFEFTHVLVFQPDIPPAPHTIQQHIDVGEWNDRLKSIMEKERARSNKNR